MGLTLGFIFRKQANTFITLKNKKYFLSLINTLCIRGMQILCLVDVLNL